MTYVVIFAALVTSILVAAFAVGLMVDVIGARNAERTVELVLRAVEQAGPVTASEISEITGVGLFPLFPVLADLERTGGIRSDWAELTDGTRRREYCLTDRLRS